MAFTQAHRSLLGRFNSTISANILEAYDAYRDSKIQSSINRLPSKTIAPSSFRCARRCWFRLRGTTPDTLKKPDKILDFSANVGTACHTLMQTDLKNMLNDNWLNVSNYLSSIGFYDRYKCIVSPSSDNLETRISIESPPIRFSCDGLICWDDTIYLLEIKTCEYSTFQDLVEPKDEHIDQIRLYASLLQVSKVLFIYQDRTYGNIKVYEYDVTVSDIEYVRDKIQYIMDCVDAQVAPSRLPRGDKWCTNCPYTVKCKEWG